MIVRIIPADELYNEFSSGTPDANAYRRYLKMLYDRAETNDDAPEVSLALRRRSMGQQDAQLRMDELLARRFPALL